MIAETECQRLSMEPAATQTIEVVVNGKPKRVPEGLNVAGLLAFLEIDPERVAVELNRSIVRRVDWASAVIAEGTALEIVWFVGGGC